MKKEEKLIPDLPSGFEDRWNKKLAVKKKLISSIEANFLKYGFAPLETPSFEKSVNIGSFLLIKLIEICFVINYLPQLQP